MPPFVRTGAFGFLVLVTAALAGREPAGEEQAVAALRQLGGQIKRDDKAPGHPVTGVALERDDCEELDLAVLERLPRLKSLQLSCVWVNEQNLDHLTKCSGLESLSLAMTRIEDNGVKQLKALPRLRRLAIYVCEVTDTGLKSLLDCKALREIEILGSEVTDDGIKALQDARPDLKIRAGNRNLAEKRVRKHFAIPVSDQVTTETIRLAILRQLPAGCSEDQVYAFLKKSGIGNDRLSGYHPLHDGKIVCRIEFDPESGQIIHKTYQIVFRIGKKGKLADVEAEEWLTGL